MQHHAHAARAAPPPHLRGTHPMAPLHPNATCGPPRMPPINMGPPQPQQQNQQQSSAQMAHVAVAPMQSAPHLREHHNNRINHQHPQTLHATTQMQKIRQQHQHLNNHINNNHNKSNHHQQQQSQYNHINALPPTQQHMAAAQQQQQQQRSVSHHHQHHLQHQQQQQQPQRHLTTPLQQQHQQHNYYVAAATNKNKYNSAAVSAAPAANYVAPKTILQNPARTQKSRLSTPAATTADTTTPNGLNHNAHVSVATSDITAINNNIIPIVNTNTPIVSAKVTVTYDNDNGIEVGQAVSAEDPSKESSEVDTTITVENKNAKLSNSNDDNSNVLPNEDPTTTKHSKEKTPMCLVNELARFNKITHQYRLTSEKGPAHCKRFTVTLKLGDEEYSAEGFKIKKAQHLAAAEAIEKTKYKHPMPKTNRRAEEGNSTRTIITPTMELNALAMKLGQHTYYLFDPRQMAQSDGMPPIGDSMLPQYRPPPARLGGHMILPPRMCDPAGYMRRNGAFVPPTPLPFAGHPHQRFGHRDYPPRFQQRYPMMSPYAPPAVTTCKITLIVGKQKFIGIGHTLQRAKHDAAARALQVLKTQATNQLNELLSNSLEDSDSKSPISLVHEIGFKRNLTVDFKIMREEGLAHMKNFITACIVGSIVTEGEGNGKKISKKRAAEKMLEELKKLPPLTPTKSPVKRIKVKTTSSRGGAAAASSSVVAPNVRPACNERRKRPGASIKEKPEGEDTDGENPITKLIQLQQNRKEKEPVFELIAKNGNENSRRREFIIEVAAQGMVARGMGNSKKLAKRNAAQNLLITMGLESSGSSNTDITDAPHKAQLPTTAAPTTTSTSSADNTQDVSSCGAANGAELIAVAALSTTIPNTPSISDAFDVPLISTSAGQVPGILILRQNKKHAVKKKEVIASNVAVVTKESKEGADAPVAANTVNNATEPTTIISTITSTATVEKPAAAKEINSNDASNSSNTAANNNNISATNNSSNTSTSTISYGVHMKDQLLYLAKLLGFEVNFSDYPKGNHNEYLTIVTLSTNPPQICHGVGTSSEESQNDAAKNALKILSELGLNNAKK